MVTVNPKIWNVIVIGILSPPLRGETKPPIAVLEPQGFNRTAYILPGKSKNVNPCDRFRALDKPQEPAIIKITKDASTSGCPRFRSWKRENSKPSLGRVAVSPVNADRNSQSKDMESQSDRHRNTPFTEDSGEKTARRCFGALGVQKEPKLFYQTSRKMSIYAVCARLTNQKCLV